MSIEEITKRIQTASDSQSLDNAILEASDFMEFHEGTHDQVCDLFMSISNQITNVGDREEAMNCLSKCSVVLQSVRVVDLTAIVSIIDDMSVGETLSLINILANSDRGENVAILERLALSSNNEVSGEAVIATVELRRRTNSLAW